MPLWLEDTWESQRQFKKMTLTDNKNVSYHFSGWHCSFPSFVSKAVKGASLFRAAVRRFFLVSLDARRHIKLPLFSMCDINRGEGKKWGLGLEMILLHLEAATQVGFSRQSGRCQHSGSLAHRFDKPAMQAALLMSQRRVLQPNTRSWHQVWGRSTHSSLSSSQAKHATLYKLLRASAAN